MTEQEWLACTDPQPMLEFLKGKASDRKLRLFAEACHRRIWHLLIDTGVCRKTIAFAERFADGLATEDEIHGRAWGKPGSVFSVVLYKAWDAAENSLHFGAGMAKDAILLMDPEKHRDREAVFNAAWKQHSLGEAMRIAEAAMPIDWIAKRDSAWTKERDGQCDLLREIFGSLPFRPIHFDSSWLTPNVNALAESVYTDRTFDQMPILADDLEKAGCHNQEILGHCRGPGPHVLGCWALDLVLGKT